MEQDSSPALRLDWSRLFGFEQIVDRRELARSASIAGKVGDKVGDKGGLKGPGFDVKISSKIGDKEGMKFTDFQA
jgi:hypothetical protein